MKTLTKILLAVVLLASYSCVQDSTIDPDTTYPSNHLTIQLDNTRTSLGERGDDSYPVYWSEGDQVSANGVASTVLIDVDEESAYDTFEFVGDLGGTPYKVSYPATDIEGEIEFASEQSYVAGSFSPGAAAMYGESNTIMVMMKHASGILKFPMLAKSGTKTTLDRVVISNPNGMLAGRYTASIVNGEVKVEPTTTATNTITYRCNGLSLSDSTPTDLFIAVPAGTYETLDVKLITTSNSLMEFKISAPESHPVKAGYVREFNNQGNIVFSDNDTSFQITNSKTLMEFATKCKEGDLLYSKVLLMNDVQFDSKTYTWESISGFDMGLEFDGQGYTISGLTAPMFDVAEGNIHHLNLNATVTKSNSSLYHGILANVFTGTISDCTVSGSINHTALAGSYCSVGGVIGRALKSVVLTNVTNNASVTATLAESSRPYIGGIVGVTRTSGDELTITNCHNHGAVTTTANSSTVDAHGIGGLLGGAYSTSYIVITDCSNSGNVSSLHSSTNGNHLGGFVGSCCVHSTISASEGKYNTNSGNIVAGGTHDAECSISGFCGYVSGGNSVIKNMKNTGTITIQGTYKHKCNVGGIVPYVNNTDKGIQIEDCHNYGEIIYSGSHSTAQFVAIGGIAARLNCKNITYKNLHNHAAITFKSGSTVRELYLGGVLATNHGASSSLINCSNDHDLNIAATSSRFVLIGGVFANAVGAGATLQDITNSGNITFSGTAATYYQIGGAIGHARNATLTNITNFGNVTFSGTLTTGITSSSSAIATTAPAMGGVIGDLGVADAEIYTATNITNKGRVLFTPATTASKSDNFLQAGCIAYSRNYKIVKAYNSTSTSGVKPSFEYTGSTTISYNSTSNGLFLTGGVIAYATSNVAGANIEDCHNQGDVTFNSPAKKAHNTYSGGIVAFAKLNSYGTISGCSNSGSFTAGAKDVSGNKSMGWGGIVGNNYANISNCTNSGSVLMKQKTTSTSYTYMWYSADMGGIVGCNNMGVISGCTNTGSFTAERSSLNGTQLARRSTFAGIVAVFMSAGTEKACLNCTNTGSFNIYTGNGSYSGTDGEALHVGGILGRSTAVSSSPYLVKGCTQNSSISATDNVNIGAVIGDSYATASERYTPTDTATEFPVMNCVVDGGIKRKGISILNMTSSNFYKYIYTDNPSVASWTATATRYHGNTNQ